MTAYIEEGTLSHGDTSNLLFIREGSEADVTLDAAIEAGGNDSDLVEVLDESGTLTMAELITILENVQDERGDWRGGVDSALKYLR